MSQEKVDQYKKDKANRKQIMKREKRIRTIEYLIYAVLVALVVIWIGFSVYQKVKPEASGDVTTTTPITQTDTGSDAAADSEDSTDTETNADAETETENGTDAEADDASEENTDTSDTEAAE